MTWILVHYRYSWVDNQHQPLCQPSAVPLEHYWEWHPKWILACLNFAITSQRLFLLCFKALHLPEYNSRCPETSWGTSWPQISQQLKVRSQLRRPTESSHSSSVLSVKSLSYQVSGFWMMLLKLRCLRRKALTGAYRGLEQTDPRAKEWLNKPGALREVML